MSWRIDGINFTNFKFFKGEFDLNISRKNVLLYGENGSGKSSVFWGAYTLFQSCLKTQKEDAIKYFVPNHDNNLRNKFIDDNDYSGLKIRFKDENGAELTVEDSVDQWSVSTPSVMQFMRKTVQSSDFITYKFLSSLFDFRNSEKNDVFKLFSKDVFPSLNFRTTLIKLDHSDTGKLDADSWWSYISTVYCYLPKNKKNKNSFNQATQDYKDYLNLLSEFNKELDYALTDITIRANKKLKENFGIDASLSFMYEKATFNDRVKGKGRSRNGVVIPPKIILTANMRHPNIADNKTIYHPQSFFNEAKLTCMALALRLAVLDTRPTEGVSYASAIFIDDMLISLDMGYRRKVIQIILPYSINRQMIVMTHDRSFFHLIKEELAVKGQNNWLFLEMYQPEDCSKQLPSVFINKSYLEAAKVYLHSNELAACANALRKACETELKRLLPLNMTLCNNYKGESDNPFIKLSELIRRFEHFRALFNFPDVVPYLTTERKFIMNPFSHDDIYTPQYKSELSLLIKDIDVLHSIEKRLVVKDNWINNRQYSFKVVNGEYVVEAKFRFKERFEIVVYQDVVYYNSPSIVFDFCTSEKIKPGDSYGLNNAFSHVYNIVSYNAKTHPKLEDCMFDVSKGQSIGEIFVGLLSERK
ncbi:MAG: AAA family ATPase [Bacteroidales bacterium]|nr:AAA family ATPase [Bacteroidales bacterium]